MLNDWTWPVGGGHTIAHHRNVIVQSPQNSCLVLIPLVQMSYPSIPKFKSLTIPINRKNWGAGEGKAWGKRAGVATCLPYLPSQCPAVKGAARMECDLLFPTLTPASRVRGWAEDVGTETGNPIGIARKKLSLT